MVLFTLLLLVQTPATCADVSACREQALAAAAREEYETFHDLAWRAVQKGKPNDPDLMYLLARAMSLSGRPGDALVILERLADMGVATDAATNDDFRRVRALKAWPELDRKIAGKAAPVPPPPSTPLVPSPSTPSRPPETTAAPPVPAKSGSAAPAAGFTPRGLVFEALRFDPIGLAYDAVSRRFVIGDRHDRRLMIIDQVSHHVVNLVGAASAGFLDDLTGFAIDPRRGDLWVVSADASTSRVHKLQLVSGRTLLDLSPAPDAGVVRLVDVGVTDEGEVLALDAAGRRILRLRAGSRSLDIAGAVSIDNPSTLAVVDQHTVYVGGAGGLIRIDLDSGATTPVRAGRGVDLSEMPLARWHAGSLIGFQHVEHGTALVRLRLDSAGTHVTRRDILDPSVYAPAGVLAGNTFYYVAEEGLIRGTPLR